MVVVRVNTNKQTKNITVVASTSNLAGIALDCNDLLNFTGMGPMNGCQRCGQEIVPMHALFVWALRSEDSLHSPHPQKLQAKPNP